MRFAPPLFGAAFKTTDSVGFERIVPQPAVCKFQTVQGRTLQLFPVKTQINVVFSSFKFRYNVKDKLFFHGYFSDFDNQSLRPRPIGKYQFCTLLFIQVSKPDVIQRKADVQLCRQVRISKYLVFQYKSVSQTVLYVMKGGFAVI